MSNLTKEELAWVKKLQKVLDNCPSDRLGFYTTGDDYVTIYDKISYENSHLCDMQVDPAPLIEENGLILSYIYFPNIVEGLCG